MRALKYILSLVIGVALSLGATAQQYYPVKIQSEVPFPSVFVNDYQNPDNFRVLVSLKDVAVSSYQINLKVEIEGPSVTYASNQGLDLTLYGGEVFTLSRQELAELMDPVDLGISSSTLPEGAYKFSFTAYDVTAQTINPIAVSNNATDFVQAVVLQNDPPLLTMPANGEVVDLEQSGQNMMFAWTPRNVVVSPSQPVKYELKIVEVVPVDANPYAAIQTNSYAFNDGPFTELDYPVFILDQSNFPFRTGAVYAWQVRAYEGFDNTDRFKNAGMSEVFSFSIKDNCEPVEIESVRDSVTPDGFDLIALNWNDDPTHQLYQVEYRKLSSVSPWSVIETTNDFVYLSEELIERGQTYEFNVAPKCNNWLPSEYGGTFKLQTKECEAPDPIFITSNDKNGIQLTWNEIPSADSYLVSFTNLNDNTFDESDVTTTSVTLPTIAEGAYEIRIDGVCPGLTAEGEELQLNFDDVGFVGDCPVPTPFSVLAQRVDEDSSKRANLTWPFLDVHQSFELSYWHKDSINNKTVVSSNTPEILVPFIEDNQLYKYEMTLTCVGEKSSMTPEGGFRLSNTSQALSTLPGTADCFPPADIMAEAKNTTAGKFDWSKVSDADEYQIVYYETGSNEEIFLTNGTAATISDLTENGIYNYKIRCRCGSEYSVFSDEGLLDLSVDQTGQCDQMANFEVEQTTESEVQVSWPLPTVGDGTNYTGLVLRYKEDAQEWEDGYFINETNYQDILDNHFANDTFRYTIDQLNAGTKHQITLTMKCGTKSADETDEIEGRTKNAVAEGECGNTNSCDRSSAEPIETLSVGDEIGVADYMVTIDSLVVDANHGEPFWAGKGIAETPMVGYNDLVQFKITFDSLLVNDANCAVDGNFDVAIGVNLLDSATRAAISNITNTISNVIDVVDSALSIADQALTVMDSLGNQALGHFQGGDDQTISGGLGEPAVHGSPISSASAIGVSGNNITVGGDSYPVESFPSLIKDSEGTVFQVKEDGSAVEVGAYNTGLASLDILNLTAATETVTFEENNNAVYAFDEFQTRYGEKPAMAPHYLKIGETFYSAKATTQYETDLVDIDFSGSNSDRDKLHFVNREGFEFTRSGNTLTVVGGAGMDAQEIFALHIDGNDTTLAGALLLASYPLLEKKVILVAVDMENGFEKDLEDIEEQLNKSYNRVGINYTIELDESFKDNKDWLTPGANAFVPTNIEIEDKDYSDDEEAVRDKYVFVKGSYNIDQNSAHFFLINTPIAPSETEKLLGKMNYGRQFGFVYGANMQNEKVIGQTIAHQLGHGNYTLRHTFENMYLGTDSKGTTRNVMDYSDSDRSIQFNKLQWDVIHDPGTTWGIISDQIVQELHEFFFSFKDLIKEKVEAEFEESETRLTQLTKTVVENSDALNENIENTYLEHLTEVGDDGSVSLDDIYFNIDFEGIDVAEELSLDFETDFQLDPDSKTSMELFEEYHEQELERLEEQEVYDFLEELNTEEGLDSFTQQFSEEKSSEIDEVVPSEVQETEGEQPELTEEQETQIGGLIDTYLEEKIPSED